MPSTTPKALSNASSEDSGTTTNTSANPTFPLTGIFLQEGSTQTQTNLVLPLDFNDSFMLRGAALSTYLKTVPNTTRFCLVGRYATNNRALILTAKAQSYTDFSAKTTEFYLMVEPAQLASNQNDCLTANLTSSLTSEYAGISLNFDLTTVCSNCSSSVTSDALRLYYVNGESVPNLNLSTLKLTLSGSNSGGSTGTSCIANSACTARGYSCCLQNQCVTDRAVKSGVDLLSSEFLSAQEDVKNNPNRFSVYPQFYYVCESSTPADPNDGGGTTTDPIYEAQVRLMKQTQYYNCLNPVEDEFSYCTVVHPSAKSFIQAAQSFPVTNDDINFKNIMPSGFSVRNNITKIHYAGQTLYEEGATLVTPLNTTYIDSITANNDDLTSAQSVKFKTTATINGPDDDLYISYRIDGTCEQLNSTLARCKKTYIQGNTTTTSTYYHPSGNSFKIPSYANVTAYNLIVKLSEISVARYDKWNLNGFSIDFTQTVQPNQKVEITYYVSGAAQVEALTGMRKNIQTLVNEMCQCDTSAGKCNLTPNKSEDGETLLGYNCYYPADTSTTAPANQTVYVSSRNMPIRYYDTGGISYDDSNYAQGSAQEGTEFKYTNGDTLKPNNLDMSSKVGFNEIYGSISQTSSGTSAKPAKTVIVKKDMTYDIYTNDGTFSSCTTCGSDYYSNLQKIFPQTFYSVGGGYSPDNYTSARVNSTSVYRSDDLLFGRACFVPATMIPWTHKGGSDVKTQRRNRMEAQHFLFANGYQRDWFGFDYGSIIGSFDGVTWFSIGNQRRIKATSNRLYLAVNSYFGDLNVDGSFNITVSETAASSTNTVTNDTLSSGAECQKSHFCSTDNDCIRQVGYEYTCQNVAGVYTEWPMFDTVGQEIIGSNRKSLSSLVGTLNGQSKRCVYRGRGARCHRDLNSVGSTFNDSGLTGLLSCSSNNYCQDVNSQARFNNRIARFANTTSAQNLAYTANKTDTFGLGARIIGRPFNFYGSEVASTSVQSQLSFDSAVGSICVPGKEISTSTTTYDLLGRQTTSRNDSADKNYGIGRILNSFTANTKFYAACPATNSAGTYAHLLNLPLSTVSPTVDSLNELTISQNLSTKHFEIQALVDTGIFNSSTELNNQGHALVMRQGYQKNACLRAPGAACFSDLECAPSEFIATKFSAAIGLESILNEKEIAFWKESLICGNPDFKYLNTSSTKNPNFDIKKNKCCRDIGKTLTTGTQQIAGTSLNTYSSISNFYYCDPALTSTDKRPVAGYNKPVTSYTRYSRAHTIYDKYSCNIADTSKLKAPVAQFNRTSSNAALDITYILGQYKTLDDLNAKTCCTTHWIRNFADSFGGGHTWAPRKGQVTDKKIFRSLSWRPMDITSYEAGHAFDPAYRRHNPFECLPGEIDQASCEIEHFTAAQEKKYLEWFGAFELVGIPQVVIPNHADPVEGIFKTVTDDGSDLTLGNQMAPAAPEPVADTITNGSVTAAGFPDYTADAVVSPINGLGEHKGYLSMSSSNKFVSSKVKEIFSKDKFNCCVPSGSEVPQGTTADQCCTGYIANSGASTALRCCLPDFTDVSVYLNRYVSSEGRGLSDSAYDEKTGYIKDPAIVLQKAANVCCSGKAAYGVAISLLNVPLPGGTVDQSATKTRRFVYRDDSVDNNTETNSIGSRFEAGLKWNNHVYCVPKSYNAGN